MVGGGAVRGVSGAPARRAVKGRAASDLRCQRDTRNCDKRSDLAKDVGHDPSDAAHIFKRALFAPGRRPRALTMSYSYLFKYITSATRVRPPTSASPSERAVADGTTSPDTPFHHASPEGIRNRGDTVTAASRSRPPRLPARAPPLLLAPPPPCTRRAFVPPPPPRAVPTRAPRSPRGSLTHPAPRARPLLSPPLVTPQASASRACCCSSRTSGSARPRPDDRRGVRRRMVSIDDQQIGSNPGLPERVLPLHHALLLAPPARCSSCYHAPEAFDHLASWLEDAGGTNPNMTMCSAGTGGAMAHARAVTTTRARRSRASTGSVLRRAPRRAKHCDAPADTARKSARRSTGDWTCRTASGSGRVRRGGNAGGIGEGGVVELKQTGSGRRAAPACC